MDLSLPPHLADRIRWQVHPHDCANPKGQFVLYWMHNALRVHENPALDVAVRLARQNDLPLLVYHGLCETYPYASDRHHAFIMQGARDVQREMQDHGIAYCFHLQRNQHRGPHLRDLTRLAGVLVTEETPVPPLTGWLERLACITSTPIACVDTACVVSPGMLRETFRETTSLHDAGAAMFQERAGVAYPESPFDCEMFDGRLPFEAVDLQRNCLANLISQCRIDHSIAPVAETPGGSRAGYRRWNSFRDSHLGEYAQRRQDAADPQGVSRMSAYLHYGMVSPFRIARQAKQQGAEEFLRSLWSLREMSFHFCCQHSDCLDTMDALPQWSVESLTEHEKDPRDQEFAWEEFSRAKTGHNLWDACQRSLLKHGELHDQARKVWGKAIIPWVASAGRALRMCIDLNHRYALDGRDPCSYRGILWCFGRFDQPVQPAQPIYGAVRGVSLDDEQHRIDLPRFVKWVDRPLARRMPRVAMVGAGISGLVAARALHDHGLETHVFERSKRVGGRMATRTVSNEKLSASFDHGAAYFTARDVRFTKLVQSWQHDGLVAPWMGNLVELDGDGTVLRKRIETPRYVGVPNMNAIGRHLAKDLPIRLQTRVKKVERCQDDRWSLRDDHGNDLGEFDYVLVSGTPHQAAQVLPDDASFAPTLSSVRMTPTWAVMLAAEGLRDIPFDGAYVNDHALGWIARDDSKPHRERTELSTWLLQATSEWSTSRIHLEACEVAEELVGQFQRLVDCPTCSVVYCESHRWSQAQPSKPLNEPCLWDSTAGLGVCGDWCLGREVESAFLSGQALAGSVLRHVTIDRPACNGELAATS